MFPQEPFTACNTKYKETGFRRMLISLFVLNKKKMLKARGPTHIQMLCLFLDPAPQVLISI